MATIILAGLIYITCECYLDDVLIPAKYEDCITNLRQVFDRFRKYKIYLNPDKCELGAPSIEFLVHTFNKEGITFSDKKLNGIKDFPLPETKGQLKSFFGASELLPRPF